jgi:hypothetical protein
MRVASFFPFQTSYYLNGHSFFEQELKRARIGFRKTDNAFSLSTTSPAPAGGPRQAQCGDHPHRLDYWTSVLGPKFSAKERK